MAHCLLCTGAAGPFCEDRRGQYWRCQTCALVFIDASTHLSVSAEKAEYDKHENAIDDPGYRRFLSRAAEPLIAHCPAPARGLDFGCGPGPALAAMLGESGYDVALYDKFYAPDTAVLRSGYYDFISATEVIEHIAEPAATWALWLECLKPSGVLLVMSKLVRDQSSFASWHYKNDPTHLCFYSTETYDYIARQYGLRWHLFGADVALFLRA